MASLDEPADQRATYTDVAFAGAKRCILALQQLQRRVRPLFRERIQARPTLLMGAEHRLVRQRPPLQAT